MFEKIELRVLHKKAQTSHVNKRSAWFQLAAL